MIDSHISNARPVLGALFICLSCWFCLSTPIPAALIIDDFTVSQTQMGGTQGIVNGEGIIGGQREVSMYQQNAEVHINAAYGSGCHLINTSTEDDRAYIYFRYDGPDGSFDDMDLSGLGHVDLTGGGQYDGFLITISQMDIAGGSMTIFLNQGESQVGYLYTQLPNQPQTIFLPFADFEVIVPASEPPTLSADYSLIDFTDVGYMSISFRVSPGGSYTIDSIVAAPEPATLTLLALGGLWLRRKGQHKL